MNNVDDILFKDLLEARDKYKNRRKVIKTEVGLDSLYIGALGGVIVGFIDLIIQNINNSPIAFNPECWKSIALASIVGFLISSSLYGSNFISKIKRAVILERYYNDRIKSEVENYYEKRIENIKDEDNLQTLMLKKQILLNKQKDLISYNALRHKEKKELKNSISSIEAEIKKQRALIKSGETI